MAEKIKEYCKNNKHEWMDTHTVYYKSPEDITAYMTYRCIQNKSDIECPNLNGFCSDKFSLINN